MLDATLQYFSVSKHAHVCRKNTKVQIYPMKYIGVCIIVIVTNNSYSSMHPSLMVAASRHWMLSPLTVMFKCQVLETEY